MTDPTNFTGLARLFPLPNLVLFPGVIQGLHIFEPRYRQLMADSLATDQQFALVLLKPGWEEDYDGTPAIEPVACLGRIGWHEKLHDGRYNLRLRGVARIRILEEVPADRLYRTARVELVTEEMPTDLTRLKELRRELAGLVLPRFTDDAAARKQVQDLFEGEMTLGQLCDVLGYALPLPTEFKQSLLAEPWTDRRATALIAHLRATAAQTHRSFPPDFSAN